jgi:hypothetical protein
MPDRRRNAGPGLADHLTGQRQVEIGDVGQQQVEISP